MLFLRRLSAVGTHPVGFNLPCGGPFLFVLIYTIFRSCKAEICDKKTVEALRVIYLTVDIWQTRIPLAPYTSPTALWPGKCGKKNGTGTKTIKCLRLPGLYLGSCWRKLWQVSTILITHSIRISLADVKTFPATEMKKATWLCYNKNWGVTKGKTGQKWNKVSPPELSGFCIYSV